MKNKKNILIFIIVFILIIFGIFYNNSKDIKEDKNKKINTIEKDDRIINNQIIVDIKGEVNRPGIYYLNSGSRVIDAINLAGGLTPHADVDNINLAGIIDDAMIIYIFKKQLNNQQLISINKATVDQLMKLPGIGEVKAKNIIKHRTINGYFMSLEELKNVEGISEALYKQIKELITL